MAVLASHFSFLKSRVFVICPISMCFIVFFSKYLLNEIAKNWLSLVELGLLDSAMTASQERANFLDKVFHVEYIFTSPPLAKPVGSFLKWLGLRNISVDCLSMAILSADAVSLFDDQVISALSRITNIVINKCEPQTADVMKQLLSQCNSLKEIYFPNSYDIHSRVLVDEMIDFIVLTHGSQVEIMNLFGAEMSQKATLQNILTNCVNLKSLEFAYYKNAKAPLILQKTVINCTQLTSFKTQHCTVISDLCMELLTSACPLLESVNVSTCKELTNKTLQSLARNCPHLHSLHIDGCQKMQKEPGLDLVFKACRQIVSINLLSYNMLNDKLLNIFVDHCSEEVESLSIGGYYSTCSVSDDSMVPLFRKCNKIEVLYFLHIGYITDQSLLALATTESYSRLTEFTLTHNKLITDKSLMALTKKCELLVKIDITACVGITDATVITMSKACHRLTYLNVSQCALLTDISLEALSTAVFIAKLNYLNLQMCKLITDTGLENLMPACKHNLKHIDISYNECVTDRGLTALGDHGAFLEFVCISFLPNVTVVGMKYLMDNCLKMNTLLHYSNQCTKFNR